jgi:hypothetical protein
LKLTLDSPADLKVQQGDEVKIGQMLSDRASTRATLFKQKRQLESQLAQLRNSSHPIRPSPSYAQEQAQIEVALIKMAQAKLAIQAFWANSPYTEAAWEQLPLATEKGKLEVLNSDLVKAQVEFKIATAQLQDARDKYRQTLYDDRVQRDTTPEQARILMQLREIETQLAGLGMVRSPYPGTIKKVKWLGQTDQQLQVELTLAIHSDKLSNALETSN